MIVSVCQLNFLRHPAFLAYASGIYGLVSLMLWGCDIVTWDTVKRVCVASVYVTMCRDF